jgi:hypothetical protein
VSSGFAAPSIASPAAPPAADPASLPPVDPPAPPREVEPPEENEPPEELEPPKAPDPPAELPPLPAGEPMLLEQPETIAASAPRPRSAWRRSTRLLAIARGVSGLCLLIQHVSPLIVICRCQD